MLGLLWGVLLILLGGGLLGWILFNLFVHMQPAAAGKNPTTPAAFSVLLLVVGVGRVRKFFKAKTVRRGDQAE